MAAEAVGLRHYYAAVGNKDAKLASLLELLQALQANTSQRHLAICCSARDTLDSLLFALLQSRAFAVTAIHSDLTEKERELALLNFRRGAFGTRPPGTAVASASAASGGAATSGGFAPGDAGASGSTRDRVAAEAGGGGGRDAAVAQASSSQGHQQEQIPCVLALTDVCLKALPKELLPVGVTLVVEYELPPSREVYSRRVSALFGGGKDRRSQRCVVIDMVEAGAIGAFRALEGFAASPVQEMPVRVEDMFAQ